MPKTKKTESKQGDNAWVHFIESLENFLESIGAFFAHMGEFLLWACVGGILAFVLLRYSKIRIWLTGRRIKVERSHKTPDILFGLDLRPETLPEDIQSACFRLLNEGRVRAAISLLYRGTLRAILDRYPLQIASSFTENECRAEVNRHCSPSEVTYFDTLTALWIAVAYGHRSPRTEACQGLIQRWQGLYGGTV